MKTLLLTDSNFDTTITNNKLPILVDFSAAWCPPCRAMEPILENLAKEFNDRVTIAKVDVDENPTITAHFGVRNLPTFIIFKDGKPLERIVGAVPKNTLLKKLEPLQIL